VFLVDDFDYLTALSRLGQSGWLDYADRNHIEKWFHTLKMRIDRFHTSWVDSRRSVHQSLSLFVHYYNVQRQHQVLDEQPLVKEVNYTVPLQGAFSTRSHLTQRISATSMRQAKFYDAVADLPMGRAVRASGRSEAMCPSSGASRHLYVHSHLGPASNLGSGSCSRNST
jgi:hypothetical protein